MGGILGWLFFRWILPVGCEPDCGPDLGMTQGAAWLGLLRNALAFLFGGAVLAAGIREPDA